MLKRKKKPVDKEAINKRNDFFLSIWKSRPHYCEITHKWLGSEVLSTYMHHILPKSKYKMAEFDEENIIILHPDIHANVELNMYRYEEINKRREKLKIKYGTY